jgi:hypothetical protein
MAPAVEKGAVGREGDNAEGWWWMLWACLAVAACYLLHRLALWAEGRGWVYYRRHRMPMGAVGLALLEVTPALDPAVEHVVDGIRAEHEESGEGPSDRGA